MLTDKDQTQGQVGVSLKIAHEFLLYRHCLYFLPALPLRSTRMSLVGPILGFRGHYHLLKLTACCCASRGNSLPGDPAA